MGVSFSERVIFQPHFKVSLLDVTMYMSKKKRKKKDDRMDEVRSKITDYSRKTKLYNMKSFSDLACQDLTRH